MINGFPIIIGLIVIFSAGLIQGVTSFGFSLLTLPILGAFVPLKIIVPMMIIYSLIMNSMILYKIKGHVNIKKIYLLIISAVIATPIGANLLINLNENILKIIVGIIVSVSAISFYFGYKIKINNEKLAYIPVGILSGLLNGSVSLSGPPIILFLTNQGVSKQIFRATLTAYFWILNIMTIITFLYKRLITYEVLKFTVYLLPALIISVMIGIKLGNKVKEKMFKKITTILIILMGILSIISGIK
ncbi:sulfite exporter TauE/SafE family protein [Caloranaerobacter ferrireducens]|uniref:sulfite exporter TauE/SafE family protein n=1 Tax=Caloranaerobacter ferrireducens TaxID=1323370 RepID=UPI00084D5A67|nr:sulfite exporter TauE/SafE family protein [Caloranaerobacter ferrireducens]